ncbi:hypothetical protein I203_103719 [Kwoniella mangroviensis CBS 8507]|uniref:uncharacterized protein n=1 Tax=Kwoniella mangroviensis CBS 8507 TaxID=1296122 RepID=UPI00080CDB7D|nr:uncharacterized protein I203_04186 [Kwoniella mangroviensis CBS 8507]OCF66610.1 hypothetical protein I203_04186 [Kwoniella mangroviensis CBS 8507]
MSDRPLHPHESTPGHSPDIEMASPTDHPSGLPSHPFTPPHQNTTALYGGQSPEIYTSPQPGGGSSAGSSSAPPQGTPSNLGKRNFSALTPRESEEHKRILTVPEAGLGLGLELGNPSSSGNNPSPSSTSDIDPPDRQGEDVASNLLNQQIHSTNPEIVEDERGSYAAPTTPNPTPARGSEQSGSMDMDVNVGVGQPPAELVEAMTRTKRLQRRIPTDPLPVNFKPEVVPSNLDLTPDEWKNVRFESIKADFRKTSLPKWREPSGTHRVMAPSGDLAWVDPFASPTLPRPLIPELRIPPDFGIDDFNAARIGLNFMEMLADDLKSGEMTLLDLDWQVRRHVFQCIMMQERGKARTLFPTSLDRTILPARQFEGVDLDETAAYTFRRPLQWARPLLHVAFELLAAQSSFKDTMRLYGFECGRVFHCDPALSLEPHIISLITTQPHTTEFGNLYITVSEMISAGGNSDVYRGTLHTYAHGEQKTNIDAEDRDVVIKVICPQAFQDDPRWVAKKATTREAKQSMINEITMYNNHAAALQGEVIPRYYGLWEWKGQLRKSDVGDREDMTEKSYRVFIEVLEDVGISMNQRFGWPENTNPEFIRIEHKMEILAAYAQLHKIKIHHGFIGPEVIRFNPRIGYPSIDSGIRLIDFTHSLVVRYSSHCRDELDHLQLLYRITHEELMEFFQQMRENGESFTYMDGVGRPELDEDLDMA